jgi:hypothetical protein
MIPPLNADSQSVTKSSLVFKTRKTGSWEGGDEEEEEEDARWR